MGTALLANNNNITYRVCTFPYKPLVYCLDKNLQKQTEIYGFHIDIFREAAAKMGMQYVLKCIGYTPFLNDIKVKYNASIGDTGSSCDVYVGAQEVTTWLFDRYYVSPPLLWSGLNILTLQRNRFTFRFFGFLEGFSWDLHMTILAFAIFAAFTTVIIAYYTSRYNAFTRKFAVKNLLPIKLRYFINCCLNNLALLANGAIQLDENHYHANIISKLHTIGYGFISTVIIAYYTAITTASLAIPSIDVKVKSLGNIRASNARIGVPLRYVSLSRGKLNLQNVVPYNWETNDDMERIVGDLMSNKIQGVLLDSVMARYYQTQNCQLTTLLQDMFLTYQPVFFKRSMNTSVVEVFSKNIIGELTSDMYNVYTEKYVTLGAKTCDVPDTPTMVRTKDVLGLFIAGLVICVLSMILTIIRYYLTVYMCGKQGGCGGGAGGGVIGSRRIDEEEVVIATCAKGGEGRESREGDGESKKPSFEELAFES